MLELPTGIWAWCLRLLWGPLLQNLRLGVLCAGSLDPTAWTAVSTSAEAEGFESNLQLFYWSTYHFKFRSSPQLPTWDFCLHLYTPNSSSLPPQTPLWLTPTQKYTSFREKCLVGVNGSNQYFSASPWEFPTLDLCSSSPLSAQFSLPLKCHSQVPYLTQIIS